MNKQNVIDTIIKEKLIVIVRGVQYEKLLPLTQSLYDGGVRLMEITYCADGSSSDEQIADGISLLVREFGDRMIFGAGTVLTEKQVELTRQAGGQFIISPDVCQDVISKTVTEGLVSIPGAFSPSEMSQAIRFGADFVKLFPVTSLGTEYIKAIKAPLSHIKFLAVGGIDEKNLSLYLNCGITGVGVGSNIVDKKMINQGNYTGILALARKYVKALNA